MENTTFIAYTKEQIKRDCEIVEKYKNKWYEFIPLLGWFIMIFRFGIELSKATRGEITSRVNMQVMPIILPSILLYILCVISISFCIEGTWSVAVSATLTTLSLLGLCVTPIFLKMAIKKAIKRVRKEHSI